MTDFFSKITASATTENENSSINRARISSDDAAQRIGQESGRMMVGNNQPQYHSNIGGENQQTTASQNNNEEAKATNNAADDKKQEDPKLPQKIILGMKPLHFVGVALVVAVGGYLAYQHFKTGGAKSKAIIK